jgi:hypothetical protein
MWQKQALLICILCVLSSSIVVSYKYTLLIFLFPCLKSRKIFLRGIVDPNMRYLLVRVYLRLAGKPLAHNSRIPDPRTVYSIASSTLCVASHQLTQHAQESIFRSPRIILEVYVSDLYFPLLQGSNQDTNISLSYLCMQYASVVNKNPKFLYTYYFHSSRHVSIY